MIKPRYSRVVPVTTDSSLYQNLPTGNNFSGSSLNVTQPDKLIFLTVTDSVSISDPAVALMPQSPLIIEAGKILVIAIWFWCLIGANFCFDSLSTIISYCLQDI